jgi:hypothetical protein
MVVKKTSRIRVTLPEAIIQQIPDVDPLDVSVRQGAVPLKSVEVSVSRERLAAVRVRLKAMGLRERDIEQAIRWVPRRER